MSGLSVMKMPVNCIASAALAILAALPANAAVGPGGGVATVSNYESSPPQIVDGADPFLLINLSVELTQQAESFTDGQQTYANGTYCPGRTSISAPSPIGTRTFGVCYSNAETYIGYFDPNKCYTYVERGDTLRTQRPEGPYGAGSGFDASYFRPTGPTTSGHQCSGGFSGNFMNWATMTALDQFRAAMTGGARIYDTAGASAQTLLARAYRFDDWSFVRKAISSSGITVSGNTFTNTPANVTYFGPSTTPPTTLYIINDWDDVGVSGDSGHRVRFYNQSGTLLGTYNVIVEVCRNSSLRESNCVEYSDTSGNTWYKPEGLLQQNALKMRYALTSYTGRTGNGINGGVLRANAKYIGSYQPTGDGGITENAHAETDSLGLVVFDPDCVTPDPNRTCNPAPTPDQDPEAPPTYVRPSNTDDIVNSGIINYINQFALRAGNYKSNDPAAELYYEGLRYIMGLGATPSFSTGLSTPLTAAEQDGYPIYGPGTWIDPITSTNSCQANFALYVGDQFAHADNYLPGEACTTTQCEDAEELGLDADTLTDWVGTMEGFYAGTLGDRTRGRSDGFWIAGLAYWANTNDIRPDIDREQRVKTYMVDTQEYNSSPPMRQDNQLWLAAKYGGFEDSDGVNDTNDQPDILSEWSSDTGANPDPDTYTLASQPANMVAGLTQVFSDVLENSASSSAAAVVSTSTRGAGAIYQAIYEPRLSNSGTVVTWTGMVRGLFIDGEGRFREDTDRNGRLTDADYEIRYVRNSDANLTYAQLYELDGDQVDDDVAIRNLRGIWNARDQLSAIDNDDIDDQRDYDTVASSGRHIFTWVDTDNDGIVDDGEIIDFTAGTMSTFDANDSTVDHARLLGADSSSSADVQQYASDLVNYIRGRDRPDLGWRNRTINLNDGLGTRTLRLGDIVHSAPTVVGPPSESYDRLYSDDTYRIYKQQYQNRRQVVYAGANDGMLHAFNGGFFNNSTQTFQLTGNSNDTAHPLGSELWAYVPYNLLPHLQWLKDNEYPHAYYVDGSPQVFDVNIFDPTDADHPGGWGTILVVGFRFGGGDITIDPNSDINDGDPDDDITMRSAYIVLDITNPENPPTLLAEISHPELGFTTSIPTVVKRRVPANGDFTDPEANQWYLVFGSGPTGSDAVTKRAAIEYGISNQVAKVFVYDLNDPDVALIDFNASIDGVQPLDIAGDSGFSGSTGNSAAEGFVGAMTRADWNQDYNDEVIYFGTISGSVIDPTGDLLRMVLPTDYSLGSSISGRPEFELMLDNNDNGQPFYAPPLTLKDARGQAWVYAGTGRFLTSTDILSSKQMTYYGLKETISQGSINLAHTANKATDLVDTTGIRVFSDGSVRSNTDGVLTVGSTEVNTFNELARAIQGTDGWYFNFSMTGARYVDRTLNIGPLLTFFDYVASSDSCEPLGLSNLYAVNMLTGTAPPYVPRGEAPDTDGDAYQILITQGLADGQRYQSGDFTTDSGQRGSVGQGQGGDPIFDPWNTPDTVSGRMSWREIPLN